MGYYVNMKAEVDGENILYLNKTQTKIFIAWSYSVKYWSPVLFAILFIFTFAKAYGESMVKLDPVTRKLLDMDLAELRDVQTYTASRGLTFLEEAPSVVTVITAEQIERQGLKSLYEVLARVPGFFNATSSFLEPISNRGFVQNSNTNYLLLVDGHSLNNNASGAFHNLHLMPGLDRVARIEIIRGPGSTLWGSDAGMGIIHIFTRDGAELDRGKNPYGTITGSYDYEVDHQRHNLQINYGKRFKDGGLMLSGNIFNSRAEWTKSYIAGQRDFELQTSRVMNMWDMEDSYDLYAKLNWKGWVLKASELDFRTFHPVDTSIDGIKTGWWTSERQWIELSNEWKFTHKWSLQWRVYHDDYNEERSWKIKDQFFSSQKKQLMSKGFGGESIFHYRSADHHLLFGVSADSKKLETETVRIERKSGNKSILNEWPDFTDLNRSIFIEETYRGLNNWVFTLGLRFNTNEPRDPDDKFLPRFAVSYLINDDWSIKYAFNTGYVPPSGEQRRGGILPFGTEVPQTFRKGADESQESNSHDLQLFYNHERSRVNLTLFYQRFFDLIQFAGSGPVSVGGFNNVTLMDTNIDDMISWGFELEAETELYDGLQLYGNYSFAEAEYQERFATFQGQVSLDIVAGASIATKDLTVTGTPKHIWNLGLDWEINDQLGLNIHYRGWTDAYAKSSDQPSFKRFGAEHYVDMNLRYKNFPAKNLTMSAYIKNLFNNEDSLPSGVNEGQIEPQNARQLGFKFSYRF